MIARYCVIDHNPNCEFNMAYEVKTAADDDSADWIAEDAADDYHSNHDGWESHWPLTFRIWNDQGTLLGDYSVERDYDPVFHASKIEKRTNE